MNIPNNIEAERAVLAAILNYSKSITEIADLLEPEHFYNPRNRMIYQAALELNEIEGAIDLVTVQNHNPKIKRSELADIAVSLGSTSNIIHHANIVYELWQKRKLIEIANRVIADCQGGDGEAQAIANQMSEEAFSIHQNRIGDSEPKFIGELLDDTVRYVATLKGRKGNTTGLSTGLIDLDRMTGGLQPAEFTLIGGRPSQGKTILGTNICAHLAKQEIATLLFSLEMSAGQVALREICAYAEVNSFNIRTASVCQEDIARMENAAGDMNQWHFIIDDISNAGLSDILARTRRAISKYDIKLIVIDYLQLLKLPKAENRKEALNKCGIFLKNMSKSLGIHVIAIAKLNRDCVKPSPRVPTMDDLGDCDDLGYHANNVFIIWRPEYYGIEFMDKQKTVSSRNIAEFVLAKQREGPTGSFYLTFRKQYSQLADYARED